MYQKAFLTLDLSIDKDCGVLLNFSLEARLIRKSLSEYANHILPKPDVTVTRNPPPISQAGLFKGLKL